MYAPYTYAHNKVDRVLLRPSVYWKQYQECIPYT
jgi:hypothetical protein